jgi:carboxymethylenebutenolidase
MPTTAEVSTRDGDMALYDAEPEGTPKAAVIVIQEAFGVNDHIEDVTRRFAGAGYRAVAPHVFHRTGDVTLGYDELDKVMPHFGAVTETGLAHDLDATLAYLSGAGFELRQVGIVGFCMGGSVAFYAAVRYPLGAAVTFYGGGIASGRFGSGSQIDSASNLQAPWLGLYGDLDSSIPVEEVEALKRAASAASVPTEVVLYSGADHGFHCDARDSYHQSSAEDAWQRTLAWFDRHLVHKG